jgi:aminoglycoside phosphotransferase (APT) family kinase protein
MYLFISLYLGAGNIWFHADMQVYVEEMYDTCLEFLKSIPGQEETSKWFEQRMKNPEALQNCDQHLKTLLHGDLWHNNIYFHDRHSIYIRTVSSWCFLTCFAELDETGL